MCIFIQIYIHISVKYKPICKRQKAQRRINKIQNIETNATCMVLKKYLFSTMNRHHTLYHKYPELEKSVSLYKEFWSSLPVSNKYQSSGQMASWRPSIEQSNKHHHSPQYQSSSCNKKLLNFYLSLFLSR